MGFLPHPHRGDRKAILRDVYEDNVRSTRPDTSSSRWTTTGRSDNGRPGDAEPPVRKRHIPITATVVLALVLVLASALTAKHLDATAETDATTGDSARAAIPANLPAPELTGSLALAPSFAEETPSAGTSNPSVADLYGLHLETIVIDAGHGGTDPGATGTQGLQEKNVTLDVARRLKARLEQFPGYRILLTRDGEQSMDLRERIEFANTNEADLFISIHVNWFPVDSIAPIETYYYGPNSDARALRLAQRENRNAGYSLAEFNDLTQRLGVDMKIQESRDAAHSIQEGLVDGLRSMGRDISDWGAKSGDFMVLLGVEAPSILAEIGSLSNREEESKLLTVSYREKLAYILAEGIANYLDIHENPSSKNGSQEDKEGV